MKNNLKTKVQENISENKYKTSNEKYTQTTGMYEYYMSSAQISNSEIIPPKNTISELVFKNDLKSLKKKLQKGNVDLDARDGVGYTASWTPLYWGVKYENNECVQLLLEHGANPNIVINDLDECCGTVLDLALLREDTIIEEIIRQYVNNDDINVNVTFKAIRTKLRGKSPSFNFNSYVNKNSK
jgi:ankyrin repeat protein